MSSSLNMCNENSAKCRIIVILQAVYKISFHKLPSFGPVVTLTFGLLTSKSNQFIFVLA